MQRLSYLVVFVGAHQLLLVETLFTRVVHLRLLLVNLCQPYPRLGTAQLAHIGYHLDAGYHLAGLHILACLLVDFADDAAYLGLYVYLVAWLYLACYHCGLHDVGGHRRQLAVLDGCGL